MSEKTYFSLSDFNFKNKTALIRVDFNVPLKNNKSNTGKIISNDKRIRESLRTIKYVLRKGGRVVLMSHLGRPKGKVNSDYSLKYVVKRLEKLLEKKVTFVSDCLAEKPTTKSGTSNKIVLLENLRFYSEEKLNDTKFAKQLAKDVDYFINDAFGTSHRSHASVSKITNYLPSCAGFLLENEIKKLSLTNISKDDKKNRPYVVILGGAKVSDKISVIKNLVKKADSILVGGAMIFTFFKAMGHEVGKSLVEDDYLEFAKELLIKSKNKIILPVDVLCARKISDDAVSKVKSVDNISKLEYGLDIGPESIKYYQSILSDAKLVVWNGPMGLFEINQFAKGTKSVAKTLASINAKTIIGGGDSATAIEKFKLQDQITHVSTGGGASLKFLEGKKLDAIKALEKSYNKFK